MAKEKMAKYADIRRLTAEQKDTEEVNLEIEQAENQINTDLHNAKTVVIRRKKELQLHLRAAQFNTATILNAKRQLALSEKDVEDIIAMKAELF